MNDRELFYEALTRYPRESYAESKQTELDKASARIAQFEELTDRSGIHISDLAYENGNLKTRVAQLEHAIKIARHMIKPEESETIEKALNDSSDTWLSEHDKAIEVKLLEELAKMLFIIDLPYISQKLFQMADSRK